MSEVDKHLHPENATASTSSLSPICAKFPELKGLMEGNRTWAKGCKAEMPDLLPKLATGQVCLLLHHVLRLWLFSYSSLLSEQQEQDRKQGDQ
jgi:hypothetical protein